MLTKSMKVFRLIYRVVVSLFRVLTIVPTALSAFFRGDTIEEFCGLVDPLTGLKTSSKRWIKKQYKVYYGNFSMIMICAFQA